MFAMGHVISSSDFREMLQLTRSVTEYYFTWVALFESSRHEGKQGTMESLRPGDWGRDYKGG